MSKWLATTVLMFCMLAVAATSLAAEIVLKDPTGDDNGPGTYTYPTDGVYKKGSFDLTEFRFKTSDKKANIDVTVNSNLEDPWSMGVGFATQMVFIFIDKDHKEGSGHTEGLPGLNIKFAPQDAWEKVIILSPQQPGRVKTEVETKAASLKGDIIIPSRTRGAGRTISAQVDMKDLGEGDPSTWGYQVVMQSNEGFPSGTDLLTRKVNEYEGQHRFGGGNDGDCDPQVMDLFAGDAVGDKSEVDAQHKMLAYECNPDGTSKTMATVTMVHPKAK